MIRRGSFLFLAAILSLGLLNESRAAEDPQPETLPAPRGTIPEVILPPGAPEPLPYQRQNRWDIWQYYAPDRQGYFRPRVIYAPYGAYYLYNGQPFPWVQNHQREIMPYLVD